ncbi:unnamed protein product [Fusarium graminearum]|uniref:Uncharacterized protein n=1 Tax=Gibberella zeae TaxID=5518 RepID=A0A4E9DM13_GIBZA|nr:unnamed protein product [Fusarium graminearum]
MKGRFGHDGTIYNYMYDLADHIRCRLFIIDIYSLHQGEEDLPVLGPVSISIKGVEKISQKLKMPHVIEFLQVETLFNHFYLVMELQDGDASELALLDEFTQARGLFDVGDNIGRPLLGACLLRSNNP